MKRRTTTRKPDNRPRCRACLEPFDPSVSQEHCRICHDRRERAYVEAQNLRQDLDEARRQLSNLSARLNPEGAVVTRDQAVERLRDDRDRLAREMSALRGLIAQATATTSVLERERDAARARILFLESRVALLEMQLRQPSGRAEAIPSEMLKTLIRLAHPDRHGNSPAANKATAWLLKARGNNT